MKHFISLRETSAGSFVHINPRLRPAQRLVVDIAIAAGSISSDEYRGSMQMPDKSTRLLFTDPNAPQRGIANIDHCLDVYNAMRECDISADIARGQIAVATYATVELSDLA